jgi:hypothetical protein
VPLADNPPAGRYRSEEVYWCVQSLDRPNWVHHDTQKDANEMHFDNFAEIDLPTANFQVSECRLVIEVHEMKKELETIHLVFY